MGTEMGTGVALDTKVTTRNGDRDGDRDGGGPRHRSDTTRNGDRAQGGPGHVGATTGPRGQRCPQVPPPVSPIRGGWGGTQPQHRLLPGFPSNRCRAPARLRAEHYGMEVGWRGGGGRVSTPQCPPPLFGVPPLWGPTTTRGSPTQTHICGLPAWIRLGPTTILGSPIRGRFLGSPNLSPLWVPPTILGSPFVGFLLHFGVPPLF